jgi:PTS system ascorbate-specific IIA component
MVAAESVSAHYREACVDLVRRNGPYIVITPGVALAHARPEDGAYELAVSAVTLARPVVFGHPTNDPVDLVLAFASPWRGAHVGLLAALARHLAAGLREKLLAAADTAAATEILQEVTENGDRPHVRL